VARENRTNYRVVPDDDDQLSVRYTDPDGKTHSGCVVDTSVGGIAVGFDSEQPPHIPLTTWTTLALESPSLSESLAIEVEVKSRTDNGQIRRYGFQFLKPDRLKRALPPELRRLFNQRAAIRVRPPSDAPVQVDLEPSLRQPGADTVVTLQGGPVDEDCFFEAVMLDISVFGMGVRIDMDTEHAFADTELVHVSFTLPPSPRVLQMDSWIRSRFIKAGQLCYGLEFVESENDHIVEYVMRLQREDSQRKANSPETAPSNAS